MLENPETGALEPLDFNYLQDNVPELRLLGCDISSVEFQPPLDSSAITTEHWVQLARVIEENYDKYDGFVILHGTDTMAYTASALSFVFEGLAKPIVFTGSQLPVGKLRTDGKENLITAIEIAAARDDVAVLKLFPGITREVVEAVLSVPSLRGVVMETFGSGNAPMMPWFLDALRAAVARGVVIVNVTQCVTGYVDMTRYETGVLLEKIGLVSGRDATTEAALTKLMYLLGQGFSSEEVSRLMAIPLRGEMSLDQEMEGFSREISIYRR